jgi:hypothetical protein
MGLVRPTKSPGVEECDNSITPGDWDKPLKLWGTLWQWPHTKPSPTNKQNKHYVFTLYRVIAILGCCNIGLLQYRAEMFAANDWKPFQSCLRYTLRFYGISGYCNIGLLQYQVVAISGYCNIGLLLYRVIAYRVFAYRVFA